MLGSFAVLGKVAKSGNLLDDYMLDGEALGRGTSAVYRARRNDDAEKSWNFTAKRIRIGCLDKRQKRAKYAKALTEARLMLKFDHQNLMSAEAVYSNDEYVSIVMDLVRPGSLSHVIEEVTRRILRFNEVAVAAAIRGVTQGLIYLHSNGIMHRDMKSDNILVNEKGIVKLTDFGRTATSGPARFTGVCAPVYAAPELTNCAVTPQTNAIDVWPLPLIAIECLTQDEIPNVSFI
ncbi:hypothetical protein AAVH_26432 [Aphelenchoides avenae]|nr:hypothetical protein AAVH_26432 [Aphelenchus avenae]